MGFFVEENSQQQKQWQESSSGAELQGIDLGMELIALGKRVGLSLAEINEFRTQDLLDYVKAYTGETQTKTTEITGRRMATQEDIDRFYSGL